MAKIKVAKVGDVTEGEFKKDMYRHMKIKTVKGMDDYSMIEEITGRVIKNLGEKLPSLVIIDGGRGQLEAARKAVEKLSGADEIFLKKKDNGK